MWNLNMLNMQWQKWLFILERNRGTEQENSHVSSPAKNRKSKSVSPEPSKSAPLAVKSPAKTLCRSWTEPWSSQGRGPRLKVPFLFSSPRIRRDSRNDPPVRLPPDWNPTACWKGRMLEGPDYSWEAEAPQEEEEGGCTHWVGCPYLYFEILLPSHF